MCAGITTCATEDFVAAVTTTKTLFNVIILLFHHFDVIGLGV